MRAPFQVLVIPYKKVNGIPQYCIFERSDANYWQFIAGGGEDEERSLDAAKREGFEEAKIDKKLFYYQLTSTFSVPAECISKIHRVYWSADTFVLPEYCFAVDIADQPIELSEEHLEYRWVTYGKAKEMLHWESNKVALFELHERINSNLF
ncbi:NUDIX hydrolase [Vallitalea okinawensis]|uniref:NUDIX hydrolase n=1 Tax=Vallitalea okinawensis TaxID=2078660 RepID=UPI000CFBED90|nr:NUDIX pyrophosphatase [Vallitalea okinawensis]